MPETAAQSDGAIRDILKATSLSRDALPYSEEFEQHFADYCKASGVSHTRQQFWRALSSAAKKGGWKGKKRGGPATTLTHPQQDELRQLLAGRLGERDSLPYSSDFESLRYKYNQSTGLALSERAFWRALCSVCKQPLCDDVERLLTQAVDSLTNGVDHFNRSSNQGRPASVLIFLEHACEMLLKAGLLQRGCDIRDAISGYTLSFENCLNRGTDDGEVKFMSDDERRTMRVLNGLRDHAQHFLVDVSEQVLYTVAQSTLTLFGKLVARLFGVALAERLPRRVLPLSTDPPQTIHIIMDDEFTQLKQLLSSGEADCGRAEAKLRSLMAMDRALEGQPVHVPTAELDAARQSVQDSAAWDEVFKGIACLRMTTDGSGIGVALTIHKHDGIPVRVARDGEDAAATITVRKINNTEFYCFGAKELGKRLRLDMHKTLALVWKFGLQQDNDYFSEITIGKSKHRMYSQNALARLRAELPNLDLESVCREYSARPKKRA